MQIVHLTARFANINLMQAFTKSFAESEISAHSAPLNWYRHSMMERINTACLRCQNGGQPDNLKKHVHNNY